MAAAPVFPRPAPRAKVGLRAIDGPREMAPRPPSTTSELKSGHRSPPVCPRDKRIPSLHLHWLWPCILLLFFPWLASLSAQFAQPYRRAGFPTVSIEFGLGSRVFAAADTRRPPIGAVAAIRNGCSRSRGDAGRRAADRQGPVLRCRGRSCTGLDR